MVPFLQLLLCIHTRAHTHCIVRPNKHIYTYLICPSDISDVSVGVTSCMQFSISQRILNGGQLFRLKNWALGKSLGRGKERENINSKELIS